MQSKEDQKKKSRKLVENHENPDKFLKNKEMKNWGEKNKKNEIKVQKVVIQGKKRNKFRFKA